MKSDKFETKTIDLDDGRSVPVEALPLEVREAVKLFDRMSADLAEASYKRDVLAIAASGWRNKIVTDILQLVGPAEEAANDDAPNDEVNAELEETDG